jgi:hypothetical protein
MKNIKMMSSLLVAVLVALTTHVAGATDLVGSCGERELPSGPSSNLAYNHNIGENEMPGGQAESDESLVRRILGASKNSSDRLIKEILEKGSLLRCLKAKMAAATPRKKPDDVIAEFCNTLKGYGLSQENLEIFRKTVRSYLE